MFKLNPDLYHHDDLTSSPDLLIRYLGTAGFVLRGGGRTIVIDPFVTRPGLLRTGLGRLIPNAELISEVIPVADDVLIGHAHHDHVLDAPELCRQTGARFIGSPSACNVARAAGLDEKQIVQTLGREDVSCGTAVVHGLPSRHGKVYFGRVPLKGDIVTPPPWPPRFTDLRHGLVLNWRINVAGLSVVHIDSADFVEEELSGSKADVLCLCAIGRKYRSDYTKTVIDILQPRLVIACHWDMFFSSFYSEPRVLPGVNLPGFVDEIRKSGAQPVVLPINGTMGLNA